MYINNHHLIKEERIWWYCYLDRFSVHFFTAERHKSIRTMLIWRGVMLILSAAIVCATFEIAIDKREYFLYYSHWSFIMLIMMFATGFVASLVAYMNKNKYELTATATTNANNAKVRYLQNYNKYVRLPWYVHLQWIFFNIACSVNLLTTIAYFIIIMTYNRCAERIPIVYEINVFAHTFNSVLVLSELIMSGVPIRLHYIYQPMIFTSMYGVMSYLYSYYTDVVIYKMYNFNLNEVPIVGFLFMVMLATLYIITYAIDYIKCECKKRY